jgi:hypothetical protein
MALASHCASGCDMTDVPEIQANEFRYFLNMIGVELDLDAQFHAINALLAAHRVADRALTDEIDRLAGQARRATGFVNELAVDEWVDALHTSVYQNAAHSLAAVGMLAPLIESILVQSFGQIKLTLGSVVPVQAPRSRGPDDEIWNCRRHVTKGAWRTDIVKGTLQLADAVGLTSFLPQDTAQTITALMAYRNKNFHLGFEWPIPEREAFQNRIELEGWNDWFTASTTDKKPWIFYMTPAFIDHCLGFTGQLLDGLGRFVFEMHGRLPSDPNMPDYLKNG